MDIQVAYDASTASAPSWFKSAVSYVVGVYDALIANPITLTFNVGWGEENGNSIATGATAQNQSAGTYLDYSALRSALASHATSANDATAIANLPTSDPTNGRNIYVPNAMLKTLGFMSPTSSQVDGYVGLDSSRTWSFNPGGPQAPGTFDPISILEHEFSEMLGRVGFLGSSTASGAYGPMDLFRYSAPGQRGLTPGPGSFSINGQTMLQQFNNPLNGGDAADWSPSVVGDTFGDSTPGLAAKFSTTDLTMLDVLGYTLNPPSAPPSVTFDSGVTFTNPNTAVLTGTVSDPTATVGVYDGSAYIGNATVNGNGTWTLDATLSAGAHGPLTATATTGPGASASTSGTFTLQTGIKGQPYTTLEQDFDSAGNLTGEIYDKRQGSVYLQDTVQTLANGNHVVDYQSGSFFNNKSYGETKDLLTSNYQLLTQINFNKDGSHTITGGGQSGLTIGSVKNDTMTGGGNDATFTFKPHPGQEIITDFNAAGPGHDTISLSSSQFANVAAILANTQTIGNDAVITLSRNDTITVQNVTAATLEAHLNDFRLHA